MDARTPLIIREGFDSYGHAKEFVQQFPTPERLRMARAVIEPEVSRTAQRHHHKIVGIFETMEARKAITSGQRAAGDKFQAAIFGLGTVRIGGYGQGTGGGGGSETERRDRCRRIVDEARDVMPMALFAFLYRVAEDDLTADHAPLPPAIKHRPKVARSTRFVHYDRAVSDGLGRLSKLWGYGT